MKIGNIYNKFKQYITRGAAGQRRLPGSFIGSGTLRLFLGDRSIHLFCCDKRLTAGVGLNVGINTLGLWADSSKAKWQILQQGADFLKLRINFDDIPLVQLWSLRICDHSGIIWDIESQNTEWLHVDELRIVHLLNPAYTSWFCGYQQGAFGRFEERWRKLKLNQPSFPFAGVRFPKEGTSLPALAFETEDASSKVLIQNSSLRENARVIEFSIASQNSQSGLPAGSSQNVRVVMQVFQNDAKLDCRIESLRQETLSSVSGGHAGINRKLKVVLANLPWHKDGTWGVRAGSRWPHTKDPSEGRYMPFPFFLAQAVSLLQKNAVDAEIVDALAGQLTEDVFLKQLGNKDVDYLVAETSVPSLPQDLEILGKIYRSGVKIILCGPNSLIYQANFMRRYPFIDFVLIGEYEFTLLELIQALEKNSDVARVKGVLYRKGREFFSTPSRQLCPIDSLPWPHRESLPMDKYWDLPGNIPSPSVQMLASRGCPFNCSFCLWPQVMYKGNSYRFRNIEDVVNEMEYLVKEKGFKSVYFDDDTFNIGKERMLEFCRLIKQRGLESTPWAIMARADLMDREILEQMKSAGLWAVKYGVESSAQELVERYGKNMNLSKTSQAIEITRQLGIKVHLTFCFGVEGETKESIQRTIDFALNQNPDSVQFSILTPFPGTRLFDELDKQGRILTKDWSKYDGYSSCVFKPEGLDARDLEIAKRRAYHLWQDSKRLRRGLRGDFERFMRYLKERGLYYVIGKTLSYLVFVWFKRRKYLNGTSG